MVDLSKSAEKPDATEYRLICAKVTSIEETNGRIYFCNLGFSANFLKIFP